LDLNSFSNEMFSSSKIIVCFLAISQLQYGYRVRACPGVPGSGPLISNPIFTAQFYPPSSWTYDTAIVSLLPGQQSSQQYATTRMTQDINNAILMAQSTLNILNTPTTTFISGYQPQLVTNGTNYIYFINSQGAITGYQAFSTTSVTSGPIIPYNQQMSIMVSGTNGAVVAYQNQWQTFANQVFSNLMLNAGVNFITQLTVSG